MDPLLLLLASFSFPRLERVSQKLDLNFNNHMRKGGREGGDLRGFNINLVGFQWNTCFYILFRPARFLYQFCSGDFGYCFSFIRSRSLGP
jgi:hypothetical protein